MSNYLVNSSNDLFNAGEESNLDIDPVELVNGILNVYRDIKVNKEIEETKRYEIRQKAKVYIAGIEAETSKFETFINIKHEERMPLINSICELLKRDVLDDNCVKLCQMLLDSLLKTDPLKYIK